MLLTAVFTLMMPSDSVWSQEQAENLMLRCQALLDLEYYQKNTHAYVKATLTNDHCAASSGSYTIRIRYLPDEGEQSQIEFEETWSRDDDADIVTEKEYFVGENLEIRRVSGTKLRCTCTTEEGSS